MRSASSIVSTEGMAGSPFAGATATPVSTTFVVPVVAGAALGALLDADGASATEVDVAADADAEEDAFVDAVVAAAATAGAACASVRPASRGAASAASTKAARRTRRGRESSTVEESP
jgi:hypothetical protein